MVLVELWHPVAARFSSDEPAALGIENGRGSVHPSSRSVLSERRCRIIAIARSQHDSGCCSSVSVVQLPVDTRHDPGRQIRVLEFRIPADM